MKSKTTTCECTKPKAKAARSCTTCKAIEATRNIGVPEKVMARMPRLDEWVSARDIALSLEMPTDVVSDAVGSLADDGVLEKRRDQGSAMVYRMKQRRAA